MKIKLLEEKELQYQDRENLMQKRVSEIQRDLEREIQLSKNLGGEVAKGRQEETQLRERLEESQQQLTQTQLKLNTLFQEIEEYQ